MAEGLFTPTGFTSPEEIRRRIGKSVSDEATAFGIQQANLFRNPTQRIAAQIGGAFGRGLAGGYVNRNSPEIQRAEKLQKIFGKITDFSSQEQLNNASREAVAAGEPMVAQQLSDRSLALTPKTKLPSSVEEYKFAVSQGYRGTYQDYEKEMKRAGANLQLGSIPLGYRLKQEGDNYSLEVIPGSPAEQKLKEQAKKESIRKRQTETSTDVVITDIDRAFNLMDSSTIPTTGLIGYMASAVPGTDAFNLNKLTDGIKANVSMDKLQMMRNSSPTGGALGQVSDYENRMMQATLGSLEQSQNKEQLKFNLQRVKDVYNMIVNGTAQEKPKGKVIDFKDLP